MSERWSKEVGKRIWTYVPQEQAWRISKTLLLIATPTRVTNDVCYCVTFEPYINHQETRTQAFNLRKTMEAMSQSCMTIITSSLSPTNQILAPVKSIPQTKPSLNARKQKPFAAARCVASGSGYAAAVEPITPEEEEELTQRRSICGGEANRGMWELLECLEKEAIMGDDDGRDPKDYNRRAKIFDKSSKIFKNIKEQRDDHSRE